MIRGIGRVILFVKDMAPMTTFYHDVLGLVPLKSEHPPEEWQPFGTGGDCALALHRIGADYREQIEIADPAEPRYGSPAKFVLFVDDVPKTREALAAKGVRFTNTEFLSDGPLERFDILDPEGNVVQISLS